MYADVYPLGAAYVPFGYSNWRTQLGISGKVYHIYPSPHLARGSAEPTPSDAIQYDPDLMFKQYQVSANSGGMFRRFAFQKTLHSTCITQNDARIFTMFTVGVMLPRHYVHK